MPIVPRISDGSWKFHFVTPDGQTQDEIYRTREGRGGGQGGGPPPLREGGAPPKDARPNENPPHPTGAEFGPDVLKKPNATFVLTSTEVADGGNLPADYTGDGSGATLPLAWKGAPTGTQSYALIMDHLAPGNVMKSYWTIWDIPATLSSLPKNVKGVGKLGTSFKGEIGYEPPHSQGPGPKTYMLTVYALSAPLHISAPPHEVTREVLLTAMKGKVLASASLHVVYTRGGTSSSDAQRPPRPMPPAAPNNPPPIPPE